MNKNDDEIWKIINYGNIKNNAYEISNYGRVRTIKTKKILAQNIGNSGYKRVGLDSNIILRNNNRKRLQVLIHQLVFTHFAQIDDVNTYIDDIVNNKRHYVINHKDCDKFNNHISNLELETYSGNLLHAIKHGQVAIGEKSVHTIDGRTNELVHKICQAIDNGKTRRDIMRELGIEDTKTNRQLITDIRRKKSWVHISKKYKFYKYDENKHFKTYSTNVIKRICKLLDEKRNRSDIVNIVMAENKYPDTYKNRIRGLISFIYTRQRYCDISDSYNFWKERSTTIEKVSKKKKLRE